MRRLATAAACVLLAALSAPAPADAAAPAPPGGVFPTFVAKHLGY
jgi:hypothetical protein